MDTADVIRCPQSHHPNMGLLSWLRGDDLEERALDLDPSNNYPDIDAQLFARQRSFAQPSPLTVNEALGIPAVYRAVSLLAQTAQTLDMRAYRNGEELDDPPVLVRRPCRRWRPGEFKRDSVMHMAMLGETISLVMARDFDGHPVDLQPVWPASIKSEWDGVTHSWYREENGRRIPYRADEIVHITTMRDPNTGRGMGPLQRCGATLSVSAEADRWARRFYAGSGIPSIYLNVTNPVAAVDVDKIKSQWMAEPPGTPRIGQGLEPTVMTISPQDSQLTESRRFTRGEVAVMFGIPGRLLEYAESGSSLTYSNVGDLAMEFVRLALAPGYLEPLEQALSDLLPRGTEVRFDIEGFQRADPKSRYEVHEKAIALGIYDAAYAAQQEGIEGGGVNVRPAPLREVV